MVKKTLVLGSTGVLGKEILSHRDSLLSPSHSELDITDFNKLNRFFEREKPNQVIHLAALVGARKCEENREKAYLTNVLATKNISQLCLNNNIKMIYMSTDTVFDGRKGNYSEEDIPNPLNYYSFTKFAGECFVGMVPSHLIIRSSFLPKDSFPYPKALTDQYTTRMPVNNLAKEILLAVDLDLEGILHIGGERELLYNLAKKLNPFVGKITIHETGLNLPKDLSLNTIKWRNIKDGVGYIRD
ncbi:MAG: dTDP-4-dehydrorhamnose reductase [Candidatus Diapherotrites archaeon ADurb.Bin253]|nr:MAG: dTDP-4-dehydrorhamnose reductase [Candidatus Diapherotrites archaeon ADurb.Bin253]HPX74649.1 sugar nucleotide-binding protein [Candidatus Pacearchaeota archaeon]HQB85354.1 sugar nucleotide-binding protein [Candidatus Pacearchaeota archaeon]